MGVIDLAQIQHGPLRDFVGRDPLVLHHAKVAMLFAVLLPIRAAQKQGNSRMTELPPRWKRVGLHYNAFWKCVVEAVGLVGKNRVKIAQNGLELRKSG